MRCRCCRKNHLLLNINKTKEVNMNYRDPTTPPPPPSFLGMRVINTLVYLATVAGLGRLVACCPFVRVSVSVCLSLLGTLLLHGRSFDRWRRRQRHTQSTLPPCWTSPEWQPRHREAGDSTPHLRETGRSRAKDLNTFSKGSRTVHNFFTSTDKRSKKYVTLVNKGNVFLLSLTSK